MESDFNEIIIRYLDGTITNDERVSLFHWLKQSESNRIYFQEIRDLWLTCNAQYADDLDTEIALARFREKVKLLKRAPQRNSTWRRKITAYHFIWTAAASILLLVGFFYFSANKGDRNQPMMNNFVVAEGSKGRFVLPDSSIVWLNSGSTLQYAGDLSGNQRDVSLKGEGYFEVTKKEHAPFIVHVDAIQVKVLGTRFNIEHHDEKNEIRVALLQGAVEIIAGQDKPFELAVENVAIYNTNSGETTIIPNATRNVLYWMDNRLEFKGETFEQIVRVLEHNFNIQVEFRNEKIKKQQFAGDFVNNESIKEIFAVMSADGNFRYRFKGNIVEIY